MLRKTGLSLFEIGLLVNVSALLFNLYSDSSYENVRETESTNLAAAVPANALSENMIGSVEFASGADKESVA